jgi:hypothetical protein
MACITDSQERNSAVSAAGFAAAGAVSAEVVPVGAWESRGGWPAWARGSNADRSQGKERGVPSSLRNFFFLSVSRLICILVVV